MPRIGFGTAGLGESTAETVATALRTGYRLIDSAQVSLDLKDCFKSKTCVSCFPQAESPSDERWAFLMPSMERLQVNLLKTCKMLLLFQLIFCNHLQAREWYREDLAGSAVTSSGIPRGELFLTSKLHPRDLGQVEYKSHVLVSS